jgi:hypothetical protein
VRDAECDNIHLDVASGAKASRPKLDLIMQLLCEGDTLKVTRPTPQTRLRSSAGPLIPG